MRAPARAPDIEPIVAEENLQSIGPYRLVRRLAQGGMAEIWLAHHPQHGDVVIKRVHPHLTTNAEFLMMFLDEARIAARLNHPGCVQIFDLGREGDTYYIAMEYIDGEDLRSVARQARKERIPLPRKLAVAIIMGACEGLHYAHELKDAEGRPLNVVHRDVSPQNILVTFDGDVRIVDFGIAKAADQASRTRAGVLKGKYAYMSPEQILGVPLDRRADVFALGVLLYELTTGRRLFKAKSELETMRRITQSIFTRPTEASPGYPPDLEAIVLKAIANDRINRFPSAQALRDELALFLERHHVVIRPADLSAFMHKVFADRLQAITQARALGSREAELDARFGDEGSDSSGEGLAPEEEALARRTLETTAVDAPKSTTTRPATRAARQVPDGPLRDEAPPAERGDATGHDGLAPTEIAPPVVVEDAGRSADAQKPTETELPAVHLEPPRAQAAMKRTETSMAAVWIPPGQGPSAPTVEALPPAPADARLAHAGAGEAERAEEAWYDATEQVREDWRSDSADLSEAIPPDAFVAPRRRGRALLLVAALAGLAGLAGLAAAAWFFVPGLRPKPAAPALLSVRVESQPPGAEIHLDSMRLRQKTPVVLMRLKRGHTYELRLSFPSGASWSQRFKPEDVPGTPPTLVHTFAPVEGRSEAAPSPTEASAAKSEGPHGYLTLRGPRGARVTIDGRRAGTLPLRRHPLSPGSHHVEVAQGRRRSSFDIRLAPDETLVRKVSLRRARRRRR